MGQFHGKPVAQLDGKRLAESHTRILFHSITDSHALPQTEPNRQPDGKSHCKADAESRGETDTQSEIHDPSNGKPNSQPHGPADAESRGATHA